MVVHKCRTILANEQWSTDAAGGIPTSVTKKDLEQWYFKITAYADRLLAGLDGIDWPEPIKLMQRNWIGRSEGAELGFRCRSRRKGNPLFHHPSRHRLRRNVHGARAGASAGREKNTPAQRASRGLRPDARRQTEIERMSTDKEKSGVFTGATPQSSLPTETSPSGSPTTS